VHVDGERVMFTLFAEALTEDEVCSVVLVVLFLLWIMSDDSGGSHSGCVRKDPPTTPNFRTPVIGEHPDEW